ncbi:ankyrin repeat [Fusarium pseudocircinatum]|uniref:Ankyrin repeat n=1 Tax=Fusarium pseudocircinatum TaxID=56676 RepID=A0A8H5KTA7_9HYPO|nr:ankyrin repeat [Fusarium pseudocircinatum]
MSKIIEIRSHPASALWLLVLFFSFLDCTMAGLLDDGDDFSNNLVSDLAPILALFGEKVTTQFMSQSTGWADCILLSMAPVGIVTIIVSSIRVGGYRWLKAIVGRARENIVAAELEVMSSTSHEACELWNGRTVVRCPGAADICEFICIYPTATTDQKLVVKNSGIKSVRIMDISAATDMKYMRVREKKRSAFCKFTRDLRGKFHGVWGNVPPLAKSTKPIGVLNILQRIKGIGKTSETSQIERGQATSSSGVHQQQDISLPSLNSGSVGSEPITAPQNEQKLGVNEILIVRNPKHPAPNLSLNCQANDKRWHLWVYAVVGIIIQGGVLVYFGFVTEYRSLRFEKEGSPVEDYAMPLAITGSVLLAIGMLICSHVVESSSNEIVHEVTDANTERTTALAMVWLQKQRTVADQFFQSAAIYPETTRFQVCASKRAIGNDGYQADHAASGRRKSGKHGGGQDKTDEAADWRLKTLTSLGTFVSLLGIVGQFTGLRGMHWTASIAQLGAVIIMTALRAMVRRHLANVIDHRDLDPGFELDWFVLSLTNPSSAPWLPEVTKSERAWEYSQIWKDVKMRSGHLWKKLMPDLHNAEAKKTEHPKDANSEPAFGLWKIDSGADGNIQDLHAQAIEEADVRPDSASQKKRFQEVSGLPNANSILLLRRHLGELGNWKSPAISEALALAKAIETTMNTFAPFLKDTVKEGHNFTWTMKAKTKTDSSSPAPRDTIGFNVKKTPDGWTARADELDAALSLWLYSVSLEASQEGDSTSEFPSSDDLWVRGGKVQKRRCLQILGPSTPGLLRDLDWWMPNGLKGILAAEVQQNLDPEEGQGKSFHYMVQVERIASSGMRWPHFDESKMTPSIEEHQATGCGPSGFSWKDLPSSKSEESEQITHWRWRPAEEIRGRTPSGEAAISCPLVVESQDSLERLYARDMFSSFVWALSSHFKPSCVGRTLKATIQSSNVTEMTDTVSLRNEDLSSLAKAIAEQGLWAEHEAYLTFIPPLSATDNLPGVDAVIDLAVQAAIEPEKEQDWSRAQIPYDWLFNTTMLFSPTSYVYWKSIAILLRLHARITYSEMRSFGSQRDDVYETQDLLKMRARIHSMLYDENQNIVNVRKSLEKMLNIHKELKLFPFPAEIMSPSIWKLLTSLDEWPLIKPNVFNSKVKRGDARDVFNFTELHHTMRSNLLGDQFIYWRVFMRITSDYMQMHAVDELIELFNEPDLLARTLFKSTDRSCRTVQETAAEWSEFIPENQSETTGIDTNDERETQTAMKHFYEDRAIKKAKALIFQRANVNAKGLDGFTPLHCAVRCGHAGLVDLLIQHGAEIRAPDVNGRTPMHLAAAENYSELLQKFLNHGSDLNTRDRAGRTPVHLAVMREATGSIEELIRLKADLVARESCGRTPLHIAALYNFGDCIDKLLGNEEVASNGGANVKDDKGQTPLHLAALFNSCEAIKTLLPPDLDGTVNVRDKEGQTPLHLAVMSEAFDAVDILMSKQAKQSWLPIDNNGNTPFHLAAREGRQDMIEFMGKLLKDLDLNPLILLLKTKADRMGAFSTAVSGHHLSSAWSLLDLAAELEHHGRVMLKDQMLEEVDDRNETILAKTVYRGPEDFALELIKRGANVNVEYEQNGRNLLHYAKKYKLERLQEVLRKKAKNWEDMQNKKDNRGFTPEQFALREG